MRHVIFAGGGTGGHLYPALALGAALQELDPSIRVHYVGARRGVEARVLPAQGVEHTLLPLQPIQRDRVWRNWRLLPAMAGTLSGAGRTVPAAEAGAGGGHRRLRQRPRMHVGGAARHSGGAAGAELAPGLHHAGAEPLGAAGAPGLP
jgi:hypothetical protein